MVHFHFCCVIYFISFFRVYFVYFFDIYCTFLNFSVALVSLSGCTVCSAFFLNSFANCAIFSQSWQILSLTGHLWSEVNQIWDFEKSSTLLFSILFPLFYIFFCLLIHCCGYSPNSLFSSNFSVLVVFHVSYHICLADRAGFHFDRQCLLSLIFHKIFVYLLR